MNAAVFFPLPVLQATPIWERALLMKKEYIIIIIITIIAKLQPRLDSYNLYIDLLSSSIRLFPQWG